MDEAAYANDTVRITTDTKAMNNSIETVEFKGFRYL